MAAGPGGILALDLSSVVGFAYGQIGDRRPAFGIWPLPKWGGEGAKYAAFENELARFMQDHEPARVVLEASLSFEALLGHSTMDTMRQQLTLRGIAYSEAYRASAAISEISSDAVRLAILGRARFPKGTAKAEVVRYCRERGWDVPDHNAGDAALTWAWMVGQLSGTPAVAGPLFRERTPA